MKTAKLIGIATHQRSKGEITLHKEAIITLPQGLNDHQGRKNTRTAVTLLSLAQWQQACQEAGCDLQWWHRRAQLLINDDTFSAEDIGKRFQIGTAILEVTKETDPCARMDQLCQGLKAALTPDFRGGVRCQVIQAGVIHLNDQLIRLD